MKTLRFTFPGIFLSLLLLASGAAICKSSATENHDSDSLRVEVSYAEKVSYFEIRNDASTPTVSLKNNEGLFRTKQLGAADWSFLKKKFYQLPKQSNDREMCPRNFIKARMNGPDGVETKIGCMGGKNKMAQGLSELSNLLVTQF